MTLARRIRRAIATGTPVEPAPRPSWRPPLVPRRVYVGLRFGMPGRETTFAVSHLTDAWVYYHAAGEAWDARKVSREKWKAAFREGRAEVRE